jgi:hypothetical protein
MFPFGASSTIVIRRRDIETSLAGHHIQHHYAVQNNQTMVLPRIAFYEGVDRYVRPIDFFSLIWLN